MTPVDFDNVQMWRTNNPSIAENSVNGTVVTTITGVDPDANQSATLVYSLTDDAGGRFAINSSTGQVTVANSSLLNFESNQSHAITVQIADTGGLTYSESLTVNLTNVNEAPTAINSTSASIRETTSSMVRLSNSKMLPSTLDRREHLPYVDSLLAGLLRAIPMCESSTRIMQVTEAPMESSSHK